MSPESRRTSESDSGGDAQRYPRPTRRGVLLGVSLAGLGGAMAGCSTAAVPYDANEAGVAPGGPAASEIPVGGGKIYAAAKVVVTQPARGRYRAFSAVCTHVGCIMSEVANGTIDCPCHGSEFKITTGAVVTGPAPAPLPKKQIKIVDGKVVLL